MTAPKAALSVLKWLYSGRGRQQPAAHSGCERLKQTQHPRPRAVAHRSSSSVAPGASAGDRRVSRVDAGLKRGIKAGPGRRKKQPWSLVKNHRKESRKVGVDYQKKAQVVESQNETVRIEGRIIRKAVAKITSASKKQNPTRVSRKNLTRLAFDFPTFRLPISVFPRQRFTFPQF